MVTRIVWLGNVCLLLGLLFLSFFQPAPVFAATNRGPLHCSPCSLAFGNVNLTKSKSLSVTLSNRQTSSITVTKVLKYAPGFQVSGLTLPLTLAGGKSASFSIIFQPQSNQATRGSINLVNSGSKTALSISVSGTGLTSGSLTAHPDQFGFGQCHDRFSYFGKPVLGQRHFRSDDSGAGCQRHFLCAFPPSDI